QLVALKLIRPDLAAVDERMIERFKREIALARRITHRNVCRVFDFGVQPGAVPGHDLAFLTMELLGGETLAARLFREGPYSPSEALPILAQVVAALAAAHEAKVVHRDLKPSNIMLLKDGEGSTPRVVVTDFGVARAFDQPAGGTITGIG